MRGREPPLPIPPKGRSSDVCEVAGTEEHAASRRVADRTGL